MMSTKTLGDSGEKLAVKLLEDKGYEILSLNYRTRYGEIDIIAFDKDTLVFVEVKLRTSTQYGRGIEALTKHKVDKIHLVASEYIQSEYEQAPKCRFDVIEILKSAQMEILHIENAF